jgi:cellulose synthase/poly-beta-1,6-N-acetylglucosamine synthase-like glycosyltransferase
VYGSVDQEKSKNNFSREIMLPKVSVVIPAYNEEKYIGDCLKSLRNQTIPPDEIIVVDNNSTDNTAEIAKKFGAIVVGEKRQGVTYARNKGFESARNEIIARIDADCVAPHDWIEKIKKLLQGTVETALCGPYVYLETPKSLASNYIKWYIKFSKFIYGFHILTGANMVITKSLWKQIKIQLLNDDSRYHEDLDLSFKINRVGEIMYDETLVVQTSNRRTIRPVRMCFSVVLKLVNTCYANVFLKRYD